MSKEQSNIPKSSEPATQALAGVGVTRLEQLTEWSEKELLKIHGIGPKAVRIWREALAEKGLSFKA